MKIVVAADPFALGLKDAISKHLVEKGHLVEDVGTTEKKEVTYYDAARNACALLQSGKAERGILFCGTGQGVAIVAGKHRGIIAACVESVFSAKMCRVVNNANVLCLGAMLWGEWMAKEAVDVFLQTRHTEGMDNISKFLVQAAGEVAKIDESTRKA